MAGEQAFTQKKFGVRLDFDFGAEKVACRLADYSGEREFSVPYEAIIVTEPSVLKAYNHRFTQRLFFIPILLLGAAAGLQYISPKYSELFGMLGVVTLVALYAARSLKLFAIKYTLLKMSPQPAGAGNLPIRIMNDGQHDTIFGEIKARWRARLRALFGEINLANDANKEASKFGWLKTNGVINDDEYEAAINKLRAARAHAQTEPTSETLN